MSAGTEFLKVLLREINEQPCWFEISQLNFPYNWEVDNYFVKSFFEAGLISQEYIWAVKRVRKDNPRIITELFLGFCNAPNIKIYPLADNPFDNFLFYEFKSLYIPVDGIEDITPKNIIPIVDLYAKQDGKPGVPWTMRKNSPHSPYTYWHKINQCSQPLVDGLKYLMHVENRETRSPGASLLSLCDIDIEKYLL